ncbi:Serine carboxypeptidase [Musa troglodytarum]|uniref:Serine carboxypeptidase n=1 Tax=Musa troglodytarum TaxID=320322 RepID=A0A9E7EN89_9LILI|nr:Serine carboxypeptidase [Musa troglodytarum]
MRWVLLHYRAGDRKFGLWKLEDYCQLEVVSDVQTKCLADTDFRQPASELLVQKDRVLILPALAAMMPVWMEFPPCVQEDQTRSHSKIPTQHQPGFSVLNSKTQIGVPQILSSADHKEELQKGAPIDEEVKQLPGFDGELPSKHYAGPFQVRAQFGSLQWTTKSIESDKGPKLNFKGYSLGNAALNLDIESSAKVPFVHRMGLIPDKQYEISTLSGITPLCY